MKPSRLAAMLAGSLFAAGGALLSADAETAKPQANTKSSEPVLEAATLHSLGMHWVVPADEDHDSEIRTAWRKPGGEWKEAAPLFRVEKGAHVPQKGKGSIDVPEGATLFAGSLVLLDPDSVYEIKLTLKGDDGSLREAMLQGRTRGEPTVPKEMKTLHVVPGNGGGTGTQADPLRGLQSAQQQALPGTTFLMHAGTYPASFVVTKSGEPDRPIIWRAAGDGDTVIDGGAAAEQHAARLISADNAHDVWFEGLTIRNGGKGIVANGSARMVVRRCHISDVEYGIVVTRNEADTARDWFVSDNVIEGPSTWPRTKGIENARGVQLTGAGHVVCFNRIKGFADAVDTFPSVRCANIDFHNNEVSEMTDDGMELDFSERNVRCFENRFTNVFQGISAQPVYGGPVYIFRNAIYNVVQEPFKLHNNPSGALIYHNTVVKKGMPFFIYTSASVRRCQTRNNLFIGTSAAFAFETTAKMRECDFDCDGVGGGPWEMFLKWNGVRYNTLEDVRKKAPAWRRVVKVDLPVFATDVQPPEDESATQMPADLRLAEHTTAVDAAEPLRGFNDQFSGTAPDLGAYELGTVLPHYGPRQPSNP